MAKRPLNISASAVSPSVIRVQKSEKKASKKRHFIVFFLHLLLFYDIMELQYEVDVGEKVERQESLIISLLSVDLVSIYVHAHSPYHNELYNEFYNKFYNEFYIEFYIENFFLFFFYFFALF